MPTYYLLFFRAAKLVRSEEIEADNAFEAARQAAELAGAGHAELWAADGGKIATFRARDGRLAR